MQINSDEIRKKLERATRLHLFHWQVVIGSLLLTLFAWHMTKKQVDDRIQKQFERESSQVVELIQERMQKYEDALWAGVALYETLEGDVSHEQWAQYAHSISIEEKYPGINGIGVIKAVEPARLQAFSESQQLSRPGFQIYPRHERPIAYPITYIEPVEANRQAVGLDIAHETNRYTAAEKARSSGTAQITGPIVLVQDSNKTPGFLFYAPYYRNYGHNRSKQGAAELQALVYAPFVVKNLMAGVLAQESRHVNIELSDAGQVLYTELSEENADYDPDPYHAQNYLVNVYGRDWVFAIEAGLSFREAQSTSKPLVILFGGLMIDSMIFTLFVLLARANRQALQYAEIANNELQSKNSELEQYVYTASHDLKSPLFSIQGFANLLRDELEDGETQNLGEYADCIISGTERMRTNIEVLLELSRIGRSDEEFTRVSCPQLLEETIAELDDQIRNVGALIRTHGDIPEISADPVRLRQIFENLIVNALKYAQSDKRLEIEIELRDLGSRVQLRFGDNGPGIPEEYHERIFELFQRLDTTVQGTGVGLSIVRRVVEIHDGSIWIEQSPLGGALFCIELPREHAIPHARAA